VDRSRSRSLEQLMDQDSINIDNGENQANKRSWRSTRVSRLQRPHLDVEPRRRDVDSARAIDRSMISIPLVKIEREYSRFLASIQTERGKPVGKPVLNPSRASQN